MMCVERGLGVGLGLGFSGALVFGEVDRWKNTAEQRRIGTRSVRLPSSMVRHARGSVA